MKKAVLVMIAVFIAFFSNGQSLPNSDFEVWEELVSEPESWNTPNPITGLVLVKTVTKSDDAYSGLYSARLETKQINFLGTIFDVPGMLTLGEFELDLADTSYGFSGGYFLQENVSALSGMYKYSGVDGDSAFVFIYNFKRNGDQMDTIGYGYKHLHDATDWTSFTVEMQHLKTMVPDTFNVVIISSGDQTPSAGSVLLLDSLSIEINTGIDDIAQKPRVNVYPNPADNSIYFESEESATNRSLRIYNSHGQKYFQTAFPESHINVGIQSFPPGIYSYQIIDQNRLPVSGSFIKR